MATIESLQVGAETQIIDMKTGKLTRQGLLLFQIIGTVPTTFNDHAAVAATASVLGHVYRATAVANVSVSATGIGVATPADAGASYNQAYTQTIVDAIAELQASVASNASDLSALAAKINAELAVLRTAGIQAT